MRPYLVIEWNDTETEATGWLCAYNFANHLCAGGTRMHPTVTKEEVIRLATCMGFKYNAAEYIDNRLVSGGCKSGIKYDHRAPDSYEVLKRFVAAMSPYVKSGVGMGGDLGVPMAKIAKAMSELEIKTSTQNLAAPTFQQTLGYKVDIFNLPDVVTGYGSAFATDEAWTKMGRKPEEGKVFVQGFGNVGAAVAYKLEKMGYKVVGISDANMMVTCDDGLDVETMVKNVKDFGLMNKDALDPKYTVGSNRDWADADANIFVPAALEDVINLSNVNQINFELIIEGANIPISVEADKKIAKSDIVVIPDFIANLGGVKGLGLCLQIENITAQEVLDSVENTIRKEVEMLMEESEKSGRYIRDIALEMFEPTIQDRPLINEEVTRDWVK